MELAVDAMVAAVWNFYDIAIIASTDTDLLPVIEGIYRIKKITGNPTAVEVASWQPKRKGYSKRLRLHDRSIWCHWLDEKDYELVRDRTNYTLDPHEVRTKRA